MVYLPLLFGVLLHVHALAHALDLTFAVGIYKLYSAQSFGPGTDLQDMTVNLLLVVALLPFQIIGSYERTDSRTLWIRMAAVLVSGAMLLAALEKVSGIQWRDDAALILLPGATLLATVSMSLSITLKFMRKGARRRVQATISRVVALVRGSRNVVPVFLAGFLLTIFSPDVTSAVAGVPGGTILNVSLGAVALAAVMNDGDENPYVERVMAMASLWFLLSVSVFCLDAYLIVNEQLLAWGASKWTECPEVTPHAVSVPGCVEVVLLPRLKIAGLLGALGTVSILAQSLVPPMPRREP